MMDKNHIGQYRLGGACSVRRWRGFRLRQGQAALVGYLASVDALPLRDL